MTPLYVPGLVLKSAIAVSEAAGQRPAELI
jgi:hypothetical protein